MDHFCSIVEIAEAVKKLEKAKTPDEREIGKLLLNLGFELVDCNAKISKKPSNIIGEIDLLFTLEDHLFIVETTTASKDTSEKSSFFTKWSARENLNAINLQYGLSSKKVIRIFIDHTTTNQNKHHSEELERLTSEDTNNVLMYEDDYKYFQNCYERVGQWAKNDLLHWLRYDDEGKFKQIDAIQYYIGDVPVFCFVGRIDELLRTCYVFRRRNKNDPGYQRTLKEDRINGISNSIKKGEGLAFPNSILINIPDTLTQSIPLEQCPKPVKVHFPQSYSRCRIIDGQHRLLGFSKLSPEKQKSHFLTVVALQNFDQKREIKTFVDINSKQQRIDGNLILVLKADLDWKHGTKEAKQKIAVKVIERLNQPIFKNQIYFGMANEPKASKITLSTLVSAIVNNDLVYTTISDTEAALREILLYVQRHMPINFLTPESYFGQNRGIRVLFRLINLVNRNVSAGMLKVSKETFVKDLSTVLTDETILQMDNFYGEGGAKSGAAYLIDELRKKYHTRYNLMQSDLLTLPRGPRVTRNKV